jgi:quercetin dioxygenase-like cupin family protein
MRRSAVRVSVALAVLGISALVGGGRPTPGAAAAPGVTERTLLDNERLVMIELVFPAGFRGDEHAAVADEFAYVLEGEFAVVTQGRGKRVLRTGEVEYAGKGTVHYSVNESKKPARVLVVLLKDH